MPFTAVNAEESGKLKRLATVVLLSVLTVSCSSAPERGGSKKPPEIREAPVPLSDAGATRETLYRQYREWKGVRYRKGGLSKMGVDCSGFVFLTFRDRFGIVLPRKTEDQARRGKRIRQDSLKPGDLVFFKTGLFSRHVGIYTGQRTFLHVSSKEGVSMSSLDSRYWARRHWQSRRLARD